MDSAEDAAMEKKRELRQKSLTKQEHTHTQGLTLTAADKVQIAHFVLKVHY